MAERDWRRGLYLVTSVNQRDSARLCEQVAIGLSAGAALVQYRDKSADKAQREMTAAALQSVCRMWGVPLLINDDVELALKIGADGVHLGREDMSLEQARRILGPDRIIGVSCYNQLDRALALARQGADYLAFGRFFPSHTKPQAVQAEPRLLRDARARVELPLVAIGGITPQNGGSLIAAGADLLAVVDGVFGQQDTVSACRAYLKLFASSQRLPGDARDPGRSPDHE